MNQICLPGQAHVADGPHDQTGMYLMHHAFRRDLDRFRDAVRLTPVEDHATWRALTARWDRLAEVLHHHHTVEDDHIWPLVRRRVEERGEAGGLGVLEAMAAEHEVLDPALQACGRGLAAMAATPSEDQRKALDVHVSTTRTLLLDHLRHEETEALPLLQRTLTVADFAAAEKAAEQGYPARIVPFVVPWVADGVPPDVIRRTLGEAGVAYRLLLRLCRPRYARAERRAFAHLGA
jgi:hemerythrin-like domain-containing protein